ncbi:MAG: hypothetical protein E7578_05550 [Ruminococcaceae bacterium]|nr:hypothetical protein [Oscillospiraceae bacterium]
MEENNSKFKEFLASGVGKAVMIVVLYFIMWGFMLAFLTVFDIPVVTVIFAVALGSCGWRALNRITPSMFVVMSFNGWLIYFVVKGILSVAIGVFVAPFVIAKGVADKVQKDLA